MSTPLTVNRRSSEVTQAPPGFVHVQRSAIDLHEMGRKRRALSYRLTFEMTGTTEQQAAIALKVNPSTINRWVRGSVATAVEKAMEQIHRIIDHEVGFPTPIYADGLAQCWERSVAGWTIDEIQRRKLDLHRAVLRTTAAVHLWQQDDLQGLPADDVEEVLATILEWLSRGIELYVLYAEGQIRQGRNVAA